MVAIPFLVGGGSSSWMMLLDYKQALPKTLHMYGFDYT